MRIYAGTSIGRHEPSLSRPLLPWVLLSLGLFASACSSEPEPEPAAGTAAQANKASSQPPPPASATETPGAVAAAEVGITTSPANVVADLRRDFRPDENGKPNAAGTGTWWYLASTAPNPANQPEAAKVLTWDNTVPNAPRFSRSQRPGHRALPSILVGPEGVVVTPSVMPQAHAILRWVSLAKRSVKVEGSFRMTRAEKLVEVVAFVDGVEQGRIRFDAADRVAKPLSFEADVNWGSSIDFAISGEVNQIQGTESGPPVGVTIRILDSPRDYAAAPTELLADLGRDFRASQSNAVNDSPAAKWENMASLTANPWHAHKSLQNLEWDPSRIRLGHVDDKAAFGLPNIAAAEGDAVLLTPRMQPPLYAVSRWTSDISGEVLIKGLIKLSSPGTTVDARVCVNGIERLRAQMHDVASERAFELSAVVVPGSTVDFSVGQDSGTSPSPSGAPAAQVAVQILRLTNEAAALSLPAAVTEKIEQLESATPSQGLPQNADVSSSTSWTDVRLAWWRKLIVEPYLASPPDDAALAEQGREFLEEYCRFLAKPTVTRPTPALVAKGSALIDRKATHPLINLAFCELALVGIDKEAVGKIHRVIGPCEAALNTNGSHPLLLANVKRLLVFLHGGPRNAGTRRRYRELMEELLVKASSGTLSDIDRRLTAQTIARFELTHNGAGGRSTLASKLHDAAGADPWIRNFFLADHYSKLGWAARGGGFASTVSERDWKLFRAQLQFAEHHAISAWMHHPQLPEPAELLIRIHKSGSGSGLGSPRFWFEQAVQADFADTEAYQQFAVSLWPRWGGSHEEMLNFGIECVATERYDTNVPAVYFIVMHQIAKERGGWKPALELPGAYEQYVRALTGYLQQSKEEAQQSTYKAQLAAIAWHFGKREEAQQIVQELGGHADRGTFSYFGIDLADIRSALPQATPSSPSYFTDDPGGAVGLCFSADGKLVIAAYPTGKLSAWNIESRALDRQLSTNAGAMTILEPSPDGTQFVVCNREGQVQVWSAAQLEMTSETKSPSPVQAVAWSPDGREVVLACGEGATSQAVFWNLSDKSQKVEPLKVPTTAASLAYISPDEFLLSSTDGRVFHDQLFIWSRKQGSIVHRKQPFEKSLTAAIVSPDGERAIIAGIELYRTTQGTLSGTEIASIGPQSDKPNVVLGRMPGVISQLRLLPDGQRVAGVTDNGAVFVWNSSSGKLEGCTRTGTRGLHHLAVAADGSRLASLDASGRIWNEPFNDGEIGWHVEAPLVGTNLGASIRRLQFLGDGKVLCADSSSGGLSTWEWDEGCRRAAGVWFSPASIQSLRPFPDGLRAAQIATGESGRTRAEVIRFSDDKIEYTAESPERDMTAIAVSPDGKWLAIGDNQGAVAVLDARSFTRPSWGLVSEHRRPVRLIQFSPDSTAFVSASDDGQIKWWDLPAQPASTAKPPVSRLTFSYSDVAPRGVSISPDGARVAVSLMNTDVIDAATGKRVYSVGGMCGAFSHDGERLCTGSFAPNFTQAKIWDAQSGKELAVLQGGHTHPVDAIAFSPDDTIILTGDRDGWVRAWNAETGMEVAELPTGAAP
jgi:WD40 repeat protein